ncbi:hypothetical protein [Pricia mediterranea]|uniref:hypothetical protein n=1 Tax=Pricia mediterranea TaxID=3076079 RepID=UPI003D77B189
MPFDRRGRAAFSISGVAFEVFSVREDGFRALPVPSGHRSPSGLLAAGGSGCFCQAGRGHAPADLKGVGGVDAEKYPEDLRSLGAGPYSFEAVVFLVVAEAALQAGGPFLGDGRRQFLTVPLVFAGPSLALEVGTDTVPGGELPIFVGRVDGIGPYDLDLGTGLELLHLIGHKVEGRH